jgi:putative nucleotidyltransferase with HDIG domain
VKKDKLKDLPHIVPDIPSLPIVASRILRIIADDNSSLQELKKVISMDQSFSSRLLKVANSPYYRASNTISDITDAITRIGFTTVQALVFAISLRDLRRPLNKTDFLLWEHSLAVSVASGMIARDLGLLPADEMFIYGLLHDIGKVVINLSLKKEFADVVRTVQERNIPFVEAENEVLGFDHGDMGKYVANQWRLPANLAFVIANHHETDILECEETIDLKKKTLLVKAADALCSSSDIGLTHRCNLTGEEWQFLKLSSSKKREAIRARISEEYQTYWSFVMGPGPH